MWCTLRLFCALVRVQEGEEGAPPADDAPSNGDKAAAGKPSPRKRRAADKKAEQEAAGKAEAAGPGASPPTSPPSRKRPASAAGNGNGNDEAVQQQQEQRQAAAAGEGEGLAGTEAAAEATPAAGGAGAAGDVKSAKKQRTGTHGKRCLASWLIQEAKVRSGQNSYKACLEQI